MRAGTAVVTANPVARHVHSHAFGEGVGGELAGALGQRVGNDDAPADRVDVYDASVSPRDGFMTRAYA